MRTLVRTTSRTCRLLRQAVSKDDTMAQRSEVTAVYAAAVVQGLALVTFPAASTIFTSPSTTICPARLTAAMFLPQAITAIAASLLGAGLTRRLGIKRIYLLGLIADLVSMTLLFLSQFFMSNQLVGLRHVVAGDDQPGPRLRSDGAIPEYLHGGLLPAEDRLGCAHPECAAGLGNGAGAGLCRDLYRPGHLVGAARARRRAAAGTAAV